MLLLLQAILFSNKSKQPIVLGRFASCCLPPLFLSLVFSISTAFFFFFFLLILSWSPPPPPLSFHSLTPLPSMSMKYKCSFEKLQPWKWHWREQATMRWCLICVGSTMRLQIMPRCSPCCSDVQVTFLQQGNTSWFRP